MDKHILIARASLAAVLLSAAAAAAAEPAGCADDPNARGMRERVEGMREQMKRIEFTADRNERERLMDMHLKKMREGMDTLRHRGAGEGCRMEFMQAMMEQMMRHQIAQQDNGR
jgi:hypothetical protein